MIITARFQFKTKLIVSSIQINLIRSLELFYSAQFRLTDRLTGILLLSIIPLFTSKYFC